MEALTMVGFTSLEGRRYVLNAAHVMLSQPQDAAAGVCEVHHPVLARPIRVMVHVTVPTEDGKGTHKVPADDPCHVLSGELMLLSDKRAQNLC